jgi:hypothetical protein
VPRVTLELSAADYDRPRAPLPALEFSFEAPRAPGALLRQLGAPPAWRSKESPGTWFEDWVGDAAREARRIALAEPEPTLAAPEPTVKPRSRARHATVPPTAAPRTKKAAKKKATKGKRVSAAGKARPLR